MKTNQIKLIENEKTTIFISVKKSPLIIKFVLSLPVVLFFIGLFFLVFNGININSENNKTLIFSILLFIIIDFFSLKYFLWNLFGKEIITFDKENIVYFADYRLFQMNKTIINLDIVFYSIKKITFKDNQFGTIIICGKNTIINTVILVPINELEIVNNKISNEIEKYNLAPKNR